MRIQSIRVKNFQGLANFTMDVERPVLFVAGHNGAGKSSLRDAIRIALTGQASRVALKKDYKAMIKDGTKKSEVVVNTDDGAYSFSLPQGKGVHAESEYLPMCVDAAQFCTMKPDERRKALFELTGCSVSTARVREMLLAEDCDSQLIELVLPLLRSGFPAAAAEAKDRATQARGAWKAITGETYGKQKAEGWEPSFEDEGGNESELDVAAARQKLEQNSKTISELNRMIGNGRSVLTRVQQLKEQAARVERIQIKSKADNESLEQTQKQLTRYEDAQLSQNAMPCPCCDCMIVLRDGELVDATKFGNSTLKPERIESELTQLRESVAMMQRTIANNQRDLDAATAAQTELDTLNEENGGEISQKSIEGWQSDINELETSNRELSSAIQRQTQIDARRIALESAATKAADYHEQVNKWVHIAEQLSPDGIPANILAQAMKPLQTLISNINSLVPDWPAVSINQEMELMADSRLYGLLSESEQWRVQTVMTLALAQLSGINLAVLDRIDVLDPASRIHLVEMLLGLTEENTDLQIIMLGTLAQPAKGMPDAIQQVWIEHGEPSQPQQAKAA
ncbi:AAA family ATPase [Aliidiomarina maris]|uniref:AAA domain-containing protein n=1 Tax=Aliidiomarina maris TaxID=531312 RepID=A0A327X6J5_9GAMM|nr:AAA family ATPase [Aliidiomarina maris]RAK01644.1 AAA domain-containing protein [Aliidiomarina maris]RUO28468.1 hypothetical protein CWE07_01275 [Aliidiomarina maris]